LIFDKKGGAIYITSENIPKLFNCIFSGNNAADSSLGQDIVYVSNTDSVIYYKNNTVHSCSSSSSPHIPSSSMNYSFNLEDRLIDESYYLNYCKFNSTSSPNYFTGKDDNIPVFIVIITILQDLFLLSLRFL
jgi:hypothetical protein